MPNDKSVTNPPNPRLTGLDLARGLAVVGMVLVNFVYVFSHDFVTYLELGSSYLDTLTPLAQGIIGAVLVGLAGWRCWLPLQRFVVLARTISPTVF